MEIIPAIDLIDGKCVRLTEGDYSQKKIYYEQPLDAALSFQDAGLKRLHLVDLDGAKAGRVTNWKILERIASKTSLIIDFGGGVKTKEDVQLVLQSGASLVTIGSVAVNRPDLFQSWLFEFGAEKFLLGADAKDENIAIGGWLETTSVSVFDFIEGYLSKGVKHIFCTDVSKDGRLEGPSLDLYQRLIARFPSLSLIASGGVSSVDDLEKLRDIGCTGAIVGKALYEGRISLEEIRQF